MNMYLIKINVIGDGPIEHFVNTERAIFNLLETRYEIETLEELKNILNQGQLEIFQANWDDQGELEAEYCMLYDEMLELALTHLKECRENKKRQEIIESKMMNEEDYANNALDKFNAGEITKEKLEQELMVSKLLGALGKKAICLDSDILDEVEKELEDGEEL